MIQDFLKKEVAGDIKNKINAVKLNNSEVITNLVKTLEDNTCVIEFDVPPGVTEVSNLKVLDVSDNVLTDVTLYIPVNSQLRLKYRMEVSNE